MTDATATLQAVEDVLRSADLLVETDGPRDLALGGVAQDSRLVEAGDLFLAWKGTGTDAHDFVPMALDRGAAAAVVERRVAVALPQVVVTNGRRAAALAADVVMGSPSLEMLTVGVTGTNGKTTTSLLVRHLLEPDFYTAVVGTLGLVDRDGVRPGTEGLTTPGPVQVAVWLRDLADGGTGAVVLEASSHALEQHRLDGVAFDIVVFTNLSQEHLDYHQDMGGYRLAKTRLVELVEPAGTVIVNRDDSAWDSLDVGGRPLRTFALDADADLTASNIEGDPLGTRFTLSIDGHEHRVTTPLVGRYNVSNSLAALTVALAAGIDVGHCIERLASAPQVTGRLEAIVTEPFTVLIDFAHTPAALEGALAAVRPFTPGRLIVLFGAGGDRDATKRRPMAEAVAKLADVVVITSDNPRTEDPEAILDDLAKGVGSTDHLRFVDRREAIRAALEAARPGDTVVLAGKGHETYQVVGTEKRPFDERSIVLDALRDMGAA